MSPAIIRLQWGSQADMTKALQAHIAKLPASGARLKWEAVSVSALRDEVVVLVVLKPEGASQ